LGLGDTKFLEEVNLCLEALIMIDAHDNQIAFSVGRKIDWFILFVADGRNLSRAVSEAGYGFDDWHCSFSWMM
jgi:hypothetical protein